ncbi:MAG TPA: DNA-3-methyladenine glycosylase [Chloroflexia bacterium]
MPSAPYLQAILDHLSASDPVMARLIDERGPLSITASPQDDYFFTVLDAIASQQLSSKVAATIVNRIRALVPGEETPTAAQIFALPDQALRDVGLSWAKVSYIKDLARRVVSGELDLVHVSGMSDEEIVKELVAVKGIGRWTAEMFLLFSLARPDVFAVDDYGLRVAVKRLYDLPDLPKPAPMREIAEPWRPYRSYASLYLWRSLDNSPKVEAMEVKRS